MSMDKNSNTNINININANINANISENINANANICANINANTNIKRIALGVEYDGSRFHGWQRQQDVISIQETLEKALGQIASHPLTITSAGRTDAGVHACCQVVHFDTHAIRTERAWIYGSNAVLDSSVRVLWAKEVGDNFDARRSAVLRRYRYLLYNHPIRPSLLRGQVGWYYRKLNREAMEEASQYWLGEQDFSSFRAAGCQAKSAIRDLKEIKVSSSANNSDLLIIDVAANAFLHHMVRNMVGSLMVIGTGLKKPSWARELLLARDRRLAGPKAPASGLYLAAVEYPSQFALPKANSLGPWFLKFLEKTS